jgi:hypothetical protein
MALYRKPKPTIEELVIMLNGIKDVIGDLETKRSELGNDSVDKAISKAREEIRRLQIEIEQIK